MTLQQFQIQLLLTNLRYRAVERGALARMKVKPMPGMHVIGDASSSFIHSTDAPQKLPPFKYSPEPVAAGVDRSLQLHDYRSDHTPRLLQDLYTATDVIGPIASLMAPMSNWVTKRGPQRLTRRGLEWLFGTLT
jgi:hypothetical protein